jgi:hypothetical protein
MKRFAHFHRDGQHYLADREKNITVPVVVVEHDGHTLFYSEQGLRALEFADDPLAWIAITEHEFLNNEESGLEGKPSFWSKRSGTFEKIN